MGLSTEWFLQIFLGKTEVCIMARLISVTGQKDIAKWFLSAKITEAGAKLSGDPRQAEKDILDDVYNKSKNEIKESATNIVRQQLRENQTYIRIANGSLDAQLGFEHGTSQSRVESIVQSIITDNTKLEIFRQVNIIRISYIVNTEALVQLEEARVINNSKNPEADRSLEWLQWVLYYGQRVIVQGYHIVFGNFDNPPSRSEEAIMVKGGDWSINEVKNDGNVSKGVPSYHSIPGEVAGVQGNNWITQSLDKSEPKIKQSIKRILTQTMTRLYA
jgi:hypothetical protein